MTHGESIINVWVHGKKLSYTWYIDFLISAFWKLRKLRKTVNEDSWCLIPLNLPGSGYKLAVPIMIHLGYPIEFGISLQSVLGQSVKSCRDVNSRAEMQLSIFRCWKVNLKNNLNRTFTLLLFFSFVFFYQCWFHPIFRHIFPNFFGDGCSSTCYAESGRALSGWLSSNVHIILLRVPRAEEFALTRLCQVVTILCLRFCSILIFVAQGILHTVLFALFLGKHEWLYRRFSTSGAGVTWLGCAWINVHAKYDSCCCCCCCW